jgi:hypothetical protein
LISATASCAPFSTSWPLTAKAPASGTTTPILTVSAARAPRGRAASAAAPMPACTRLRRPIACVFPLSTISASLRLSRYTFGQIGVAVATDGG